MLGAAQDEKQLIWAQPSLLLPHSRHPSLGCCSGISGSASATTGNWAAYLDLRFASSSLRAQSRGCQQCVLPRWLKESSCDLARYGESHSGAFSGV